MATARQAERWLALEYTTVITARIVQGFTEQGELLGPKNLLAITGAYGLLAALALSDTTAELAAMLGLLLVLAVLLRRTQSGRPLGADAAQGIARFASNVAKNPPTLARGVR